MSAIPSDDTAPRPARRRRTVLRRVFVTTAAVFMVLTLFVAFLHTGLGRPLLRALAGGGCPLDGAAPMAVEQARLDAARATAGAEPAPARPALVFSFETTTVADVTAWADAHGLDCEVSRGDTFVSCAQVPGALVERGDATLADVSFGFSPATGKLVNLTTLRSRLTPAEAAEALARNEAALAAVLGPPTRASGRADAAGLAPRLATATRIYRFKDYQAEVSGTSYPGRGVIVREHFMAVD
ncbi:MAG: hypothetical protein H6745_22910 [Deltaproteobacteria bacterium]|nr:hypothetical protein [Deltaproteobacteria bacterium]